MSSPLSAHLGRAGRLSDPVRLLSSLILVNTVVGLAVVFVITMARVSSMDDVPIGAIVAVTLLAACVQPLGMWLLLQPARREPVFYLRAFRSDAQAGTVRRLVRTALGSRYRLCGIRPPRERVSWPSRLLLTGATGFRYLGTDQFELEAQDHNWMPRLLASYERARLVFIDVRDVTPYVADEIRLSVLAMGPARCVMLTDASKSEAEWRHLIGELLNRPGGVADLQLLSYDGDSPEQHRAFLCRAVEFIQQAPSGTPDVTAAAELVSERVPLEQWATPVPEKDWAQLAASAVLLNGAGLVPTGWSMVPIVIVGLITMVFFWRALLRAWRDARLRRGFQAIVGGRNPLWRPRASAGLTALGMLLAIAPAAFAIPALMRARMSGNEISAEVSLKAIQVAEVAYSVTCGNDGYAVDLRILGTPPPGSSEGFLSPDLTSGATVDRYGYRITLTEGAGAEDGPKDCNGAPTRTAFYASAVPLEFGSTGTRSFATNASNTVWQLSAPAAPREPFGSPAEPIQ